VTIKLKEATASQLFKRLNSYAKQHPLYQALKEFGKIIKSLFMLRYISDLTLRQAIEKQLNKGELGNRFNRALSFGGNHELRFADKEEQEVADACRRLIRNAVLCWNYLYLSQRLAQASSEEQQTLLKTIRSGSAVAWGHINMHGEYDFSSEKLVDSLDLTNPKLIDLNHLRIWETESESKD
jgi:TnpA family transposase